MTKRELREILKIKRKYFGEVLRAHADNCISEYFFAEFGGYNSFFIYNSLPSEAGTKQITDTLLQNGKRVFLPRTEGKNIVAVPYDKGVQIVKSSYGIGEPAGASADETADVTVTPLLGINSRGYRIGYGGGFYDGYFKDRHTLKVGIGYFFQICEFAEEEHDIPLDYFVCERGIYRFGK